MWDAVAWVGPWAVYVVALLALGGKDSRPPRPNRWSLLLWSAVAIPSLLQTVWPVLLEAGERRETAVTQGQVWRLVTSAFLQDGGWGGTLFNLLALALVLVAVQDWLSGRQLFGLFLLGAVVSNLLTLAFLGTSGAGNSMATLFLATATVALQRKWLPLSLLVVSGLALCAVGDQHGLPVVAALALGLWPASDRARIG